MALVRSRFESSPMRGGRAPWVVVARSLISRMGLRLGFLVVGLCGCDVEAGREADAVPFLFPEPQEVRFGKELSLKRGSAWRIVTTTSPDPLVEKAAQRLERVLRRRGMSVSRTPAGSGSGSGSGPLVVLGVQGELGMLDAGLRKARAAVTSEPQGYGLVAEKGPRILIGGRDGLGVLYGVTTLEQLIKPRRSGNELSLRSCRIRDWPDIKHREWGELVAGGFAPWITDAEYNDTFEETFEKYIQDSLVRRRINLISTRLGGFKYYVAAGQNPVLRERLRIAVRLAREYGIEVEYAGVTLVETDPKLKDTPPYDELIWHDRPWGGAFICYTRDDLIQKAAERLADFLIEVEIRQVYLHQYDGLGGGWKQRCSQCRKAFPDDTDADRAALGAAQARLGNLYYEALKSRIPDIRFVMVPTLYRGVRDSPIFHDVLHRGLAKGITTVMREGVRSEVEALRKRYPKRPLYSYVEADQSTGYAAPFTWIARFTKDYFFDNPDDILFVWTRGAGDPHIDASSYAFYAWNVDALGAEKGTEPLLDPRRETLGLPPKALEAMKKIVEYEYGAPWGELFPKVALTWISTGVARTPHIFDPRQRERRALRRLRRLRGWFEELARDMSDSDAWLEFHRLQLAEAKRMEPIYDSVFTREDVPPQMWRLYAWVKGASVLAEPRLRHLECLLQEGGPSSKSLAAARRSVERARLTAEAVKARVKGVAGRNGWRHMQVTRVLDEILDYLEKTEQPPEGKPTRPTAEVGDG